MASPPDRTVDAAVDAALTAGTVAVVLVAVTVSDEPGARPLTALGYALAVLIAAPILVRRRWPLGALLAAAGLLIVYYATGFPGIPPALPLAVVLYTAAAAGHLRWAVVVSAVFVAGGLIVLVGRKNVPILDELSTQAEIVALLVAVILLGEFVRTRRRRIEEESSRLVAEERLRIARELHDVLAHTISVITVQAGVAADVLTDSPAEAEAALTTIRSASRQAVGELQATLGVLRADGAPHTPAPGLDRLDELLAAARGSGLRVDTDVRGEPGLLPPAVDLTAYRIVQESLTNVIRHAHATSATVAVAYSPASLDIRVDDDGTAPVAAVRRGHGIDGMTERAGTLGGTFHCGPRPGGGYRVTASLPTRDIA